MYCFISKYNASIEYIFTKPQAIQQLEQYIVMKQGPILLVMSVYIYHSVSHIFVSMYFYINTQIVNKIQFKKFWYILLHDHFLNQVYKKEKNNWKNSKISWSTRIFLISGKNHRKENTFLSRNYNWTSFIFSKILDTPRIILNINILVLFYVVCTAKKKHHHIDLSFDMKSEAGKGGGGLTRIKDFFV